MRFMKSDKGNNIVVMTTESYKEGVLKLLNNTVEYELISLFEIHKRQGAIHSYLYEALMEGDISGDLYDFCVIEHPRIGIFFGIPKSHKSLENPPFRPIVSSSHSITEGLALVIDALLGPTIQQEVSFLKDSWHFLAKLNTFLTTFSFDPTLHVMITADVVSLYSCIPHDLGIEAVNNFLLKYYNGFSKRTVSLICRFLEIILENNFFVFEQTYYRQKKGAAMGSSAAPAYANVVMAMWEREFMPFLVDKYHIMFHCRFIDDLFFILDRKDLDLGLFLRDMNSFSTFIQFVIGGNGINIDFLDVNLMWDSEDMRLHSLIHRKHTFNNGYLHYKSGHPKHVISNIPKGQFIRASRMTSKNSDALNEFGFIISLFLDRGFPLNELTDIATDVFRRRTTDFAPILCLMFDNINTKPVRASDQCNTHKICLEVHVIKKMLRLQMAEKHRLFVLCLAFLILLTTVRTQQLQGFETATGVCTCNLNLSVWDFPIQDFKTLATQVEQCISSVKDANAQVVARESRIQDASATLKNLSDHLKQFEKINAEGLYNPLNFRLLEQEVNELGSKLQDAKKGKITDELLQELVSEVVARESRIQDASATLKNLSDHLKQFEKINAEGLYNPLNFRLLEQEVNELGSKLQDAKKGKITDELLQELVSEIEDVQGKVQNMQSYDKTNLLYFRDKVRKIKNRLQSCSTYDIENIQCYSRLLSNISEPLVSEVNHQGTSYPFGAWGKDSMVGQPDKYWMYVLISSHIYVNYMRIYPTFGNFVKKTGYTDLALTSSHTTTNSIMGPGGILYNNSLYYNCYRAGDICKYNVVTRAITSSTIPGAGYNDKFPYCYYSCYTYTDIDFSADEKGLWVIYATEANYGNIVISKLNSETLNITQTWNTRLFKRAVTNAFMVCGMLYATRFVTADVEEIFYMFDTETSSELSTLKIPFTKIGGRVSNIHYNANDKRLYVFNEGYMAAYELYF
ncbi:uncharacterized protein LOC122808573 [Protopterus annectens]|uniref:uncharacterized protein LOC122808573 n=1 Tax=Protopterus annectens TaxID=7888 RepID=UPI001CFC158C|nr:uncharacterized protein LOC122808573 [Protopterus annectens]